MSRIMIQNADIVAMQADAIVNAANEHLKQGSGVCGAIFAAAGADRLAKECAHHIHCAVGYAVLTPACDLEKNGVKYIIHAVGPKYVDGRHGEARQLESCYRYALMLAADNGCRSIAFPLISSGKFGYPKEEAWEIALSACMDWIGKNKETDLDIIFVGQNEDTLNMGRDILKRVASRKNTAGSLKLVFFWKDDEENGEFSNWYRAPFVIEGIQYSCVEQYMMSRKALLFKDYTIYDQIMTTASRHQMKALGRQVRNYDTSLWAACRVEVVYNACFAKFTQNPALTEKLLSTGDSILMEASPADEVWGIGLDAQTAAGMDPAAWPGQGLLGRVLMQVREELKEE